MGEKIKRELRGLAREESGGFSTTQTRGHFRRLDRSHYRFVYAAGYAGEPISLALPVRETPYEFEKFPAVFEGLLPEGLQLEALLRRYKVDRTDMFQQLLIVGEDVVGSLTIKEMK